MRIKQDSIPSINATSLSCTKHSFILPELIVFLAAEHEVCGGILRSSKNEALD